jgi:hypothetical protein
MVCFSVPCRPATGKPRGRGIMGQSMVRRARRSWRPGTPSRATRTHREGKLHRLGRSKPVKISKPVEAGKPLKPRSVKSGIKTLNPLEQTPRVLWAKCPQNRSDSPETG